MRADSRRVPDNHRSNVQHVAESMALSRWENEGGAGDAEPGPVQSPFAAPPSGRTALQVAAIIFAVAAAGWLLFRLERLAVLLAVSTVFAYVAAPLVRVAEHPVRIGGRPRRLSRGMAIGLVYVVVLGGSVGAAFVLLPVVGAQVSEAVARAPAYAESARAWAQGWSRAYERASLPSQVREGINRSMQQVGDTSVEYARGASVALVGVASDVPLLILVPVLAFFFLKDADLFRRAAISALPHGVRARGKGLFEELNSTLASYVRAQLLACLLVGVVCGIGFAVMDVPYAVALGALAGILEFVPLVGPLVTAVVAVSLAAIHAPWSALWVGGFLVVLRVVEDYVVYPRLIRHGTHLHPAAVIVAVLAGAELGGIAGIFLAVPVLAVLAVLYRHWVEWRGDSLPSQQPAFSSGTSYPAYPRARAGHWESRDAPSRRAAGFQA